MLPSCAVGCSRLGAVPISLWLLPSQLPSPAMLLSHALQYDVVYLCCCRAKKASFVPVCHQLLPSKPPTPAIAAGGAAAKGGVTATPTPMLGATPELNTRPGDKPLDPSVRRVVPASASTPSLVQVSSV
jgi:hypothetical protein